MVEYFDFNDKFNQEFTGLECWMISRHKCRLNQALIAQFTPMVFPILESMCKCMCFLCEIKGLTSNLFKIRNIETVNCKPNRYWAYFT